MPPTYGQGNNKRQKLTIRGISVHQGFSTYKLTQSANRTTNVVVTCSIFNSILVCYARISSSIYRGEWKKSFIFTWPLHINFHHIMRNNIL